MVVTVLTEESEESQESQESAESQETEATEESEKTVKNQESQVSEESQETEETVKNQESQRIHGWCRCRAHAKGACTEDSAANAVQAIGDSREVVPPLGISHAPIIDAALAMRWELAAR